jgi:hypothetical protein
MNEDQMLDKIKALSKAIEEIVAPEMKDELSASMVITALIDALALALVTASCATNPTKLFHADFDHLEEGVTRAANQLRKFVREKSKAVNKYAKDRRP